MVKKCTSGSVKIVADYVQYLLTFSKLDQLLKTKFETRIGEVKKKT